LRVVDLHCHILPGVDDGALDRRDSAGMARQAAGDGIEAICATPHIRHDHDVRIDEVAGRVAALNAQLREEGVPVAVLQGGEVAETAVEALSEEELARISLGGGRWVLLEPAPGPLGDSLERRVEHLAERGHRSLIAHPERHVSADMFERMARLVEAGALIQATADFFLREATAEGMLALAERRLVHVLSSDAHSSHGGRPVHLSAAFAKLREAEPLAAHLDWIAETAPRAIVEGGKLDVPWSPAP
jgi:protein-tyrosine phosphatase